MIVQHIRSSITFLYFIQLNTFKSIVSHQTADTVKQ